MCSGCPAPTMLASQRRPSWRSSCDRRSPPSPGMILVGLPGPHAMMLYLVPSLSHCCPVKCSQEKRLPKQCGTCAQGFHISPFQALFSRIGNAARSIRLDLHAQAHLVAVVHFRPILRQQYLAAACPISAGSSSEIQWSQSLTDLLLLLLQKSAEGQQALKPGMSTSCMTSHCMPLITFVTAPAAALQWADAMLLCILLL